MLRPHVVLAFAAFLALLSRPVFVAAEPLDLGKDDPKKEEPVPPPAAPPAQPLPAPPPSSPPPPPPPAPTQPPTGSGERFDKEKDLKEITPEIQKKIDEAIAKSKAFLVKASLRTGYEFPKKGKVLPEDLRSELDAFPYGRAEEALVGLALIQGGTPPSDPLLGAFWLDLFQEEGPKPKKKGKARSVPTTPQQDYGEKTYGLGLQLMFADAMMHAPCGEVWPASREEKEKVLAWMRKKVDALASGCVGGAWTYDVGQSKTYPVTPGSLGSAALIKAVEAAKAYDYSNTQYAVLGLKAAALNGINPQGSEAIWMLILQQFLWGQEPAGPKVQLKVVPERPTSDGKDPLSGAGWTEVGTHERTHDAFARGWGYTSATPVRQPGQPKKPKGKAADQPPPRLGTETMTAAGLTALLVARTEVGKLSPAEIQLIDAGIRDGLAWFQDTWDARASGKGKEKEPRGAPAKGGENGNIDGYLLYGIERLGVLGNLKSLGGHAWYAEGAKELLDAQTAEGSWTGRYQARVSTSFGLLFLCLGTRAAYAKGYEVGEVEEPQKKAPPAAPAKPEDPAKR